MSASSALVSSFTIFIDTFNSIGSTSPTIVNASSVSQPSMMLAWGYQQILLRCILLRKHPFISFFSSPRISVGFSPMTFQHL